MLAVRMSEIRLRDSGFNSLVNHVSAQRQRQAVVLFAPPDAEIFADHKPFVLISQLPFVNDQAHVRRTGAHRLEKSGRTARRRNRISFAGLPSHSCSARNALVMVPGTAIFFRAISSFENFCLGHQHRAVAVAHARAAGQQRVFVAHISVGVNADRRNIQFAARGAFVQRLDVLQNVLKPEAVRRNQFLRQPVKHEGVIRVRRMAKRQSPLRHGRKLTHSA